MRQIFIVFQYTLRDAAKKKAFIISTVVILALILVLSLIPRTMSLFSEDESAGSVEESANEETEQNGSGEEICYYIDENELIPSGQQALAAAFPENDVRPGETAKLEQYRKEIEENGEISVVSVTEQDGRPHILVICKDFMSGIDSQLAAETLGNLYTQTQLMEKGLTREEIAAATEPLPLEEEAAGQLDMTGYMLGIIFTMLMFFAVYYYGYGVAMSVATEKTSRVMETLIVSAKPSRILIGKCLAMGVLGLLQFGGVILFAVICCSLFIPEGFQLFGATLSLNAVTPYSALFLLIYFVLGYSLYAMLNAVCGASVSKIEDVNSAMMPVSLVAVLGFYLGYFTSISSSGNGTLQKIAMYLPISSPFMVPSRLLNGGMETGEMLISIGILLISIVLLVIISMRIYSASVLHYGKRQKIWEMYNKKI